MCDRERTESAKGGGTWGRVPRAPGFSRSFWPSSAHGVRQCPTPQWCSVAVCTEHVPGSSPGPGCSEILLGRPQTGGLAAAWPTFVSSRSEGHGPKAPTVNQSLGCPVWSRLLQVNQDPQQTGCSEGLESPRESRAKASPASCGQVRPPLRLSVHSQAGAPREQGRGASSSRAAEKSLRVLE